MNNILKNIRENYFSQEGRVSFKEVDSTCDCEDNDCVFCGDFSGIHSEEFKDYKLFYYYDKEKENNKKRLSKKRLQKKRFL